LKTQREQLGVQIENMGPIAEEASIAEQVAREVLGQRTYTDIEKRGSTSFTGPFELQRLAQGTHSMNTSSVDHPAAKGASTWPTLSEAEQEVAILAAAGWPNSAIAVRRGTSTRTTDAQISSIFQKLMISSREEIVGFIPQDQSDRVSAERSHLPRQSRNKPPRANPPPPQRN
jgi:DNA-binding NarL/FixJ family response regulator